MEILENICPLLNFVPNETYEYKKLRDLIFYASNMNAKSNDFLFKTIFIDFPKDREEINRLIYHYCPKLDSLMDTYNICKTLIDYCNKVEPFNSIEKIGEIIGNHLHVLGGLPEGCRPLFIVIDDDTFVVEKSGVSDLLIEKDKKLENYSGLKIGFNLIYAL